MRPNPRRKFNFSLLLISFFAFITLALPVVRNSGSLVPWFAHAAGKPEAVPSQRRQRERGQPCPTCEPPSPRRIYAPAIELPEAERCEIVLNSRSPNPIDVTPTFYTANGETVVGTPVQLQPAEIRFVPIEQLMPETLRDQRKMGGIALSYTGGVLEVWAQITFHGVGGSGSIDETFNILEEPGSDTREAVWWMPKRSTAVIALGNSSGTAIHTTAQFSKGDSEEIDIPPFATKFIRRHAQDRETESVKLTNVGPDGSLRVAGFVTAQEQNFTSSIRFYDTKRTVQSNLYATNLRLATANARMVLKNTSDAAITVRPRFFSSAGEQGNPLELPQMTLQPRQIVDVDLNDLREAASTRTDLASVSAQVLNNGAPGSLIGALYSTDRSSQLAYDVPLRDSGKMRNSTGSYPWRVDGDYTTIVNITNINDQVASFIVDIRYPGGHYFLPAKELAVGGTTTFDLRQLISEQKPDSKGNVIPLSTEGGQFHWSVFGGAAASKFIGRSEVVSLSQRVSSSYSCPSCCPDSGPFGYLISPGSVAVGGFAQVETEGEMMDCNGYPTDTGLYIYPWWMDNSSIASVNSTGGVQGLSPGSTFVNGSWVCYIWFPGPEDCARDTEEASDSEPVLVNPRIDSVSPDRGSVNSTVGISIIGAGFGSGSTVSVGGTGVTASVQSFSATSLSVTLTIASNATAGNHGLTVTRSGRPSNSVTFFVQIPTSLRRDSMSDLINQPGGCGVTRTLVYQLLDQEQANINSNATLKEAISNFSGPAGVKPPDVTNIQMASGMAQDTVGYLLTTCPSPFTATFTQTFSVVIGTQSYSLTTSNAISMGRTSTGSKFVNITLTP